MEGLKRKWNWLQVSSVVIIALLTLEVILLMTQNRQLRETCAVSSGGIMKSGEQVQEFDMISFDNAIHPFKYSDRAKQYLFFILSPGCSYCENNLVQWNMIFASSRNRNVDIFGISLSPAEIAASYVTEKNIPFNTVAVDSSFARKYKVVGTPQTMLINGDGTVQQVWVGELNENQTNEIRELISSETR